MAISLDPTVWLIVFIVYGYSSFYIKDTIIYRIALALVLFSGMSTYFVQSINAINTQSLQLLFSGDLTQIFLIILGLLALTILSKNYAWISRYPTAYLIGIGVALTAAPNIELLLAQFLTLLQPLSTDFPKAFVILIVFILILAYFIIRKVERKGFTGRSWYYVTRSGRLLLMLGLGLLTADTLSGFFDYVYYGYEKLLWDLLGLGPTG